MKTTTYKCDKCGEEASGTNTIGLDIVEVRWGQYETHVTQGEWCKKCRIEMGCIYDGDKKPVAEDESPPTLEDLVREIVRDEIPEP